MITETKLKKIFIVHEKIKSVLAKDILSSLEDLKKEILFLSLLQKKCIKN